VSINQMREFVIGQYPDSQTWAARVKKMNDNQVIAIYYNMKRRLCNIKSRAGWICSSLSYGLRFLRVRSCLLSP
jgi:hypothetical protein